MYTIGKSMKGWICALVGCGSVRKGWDIAVGYGWVFDFPEASFRLHLPPPFHQQFYTPPLLLLPLLLTLKLFFK